jgi:zinc transporter 2
MESIMAREKEDELFKKSHDETRRAMKKLCCVSVICIMFMCIELVGGLLAGSLAIMTDAAHLLSDVSGIFISLFALWIGRRPATR